MLGTNPWSIAAPGADGRVVAVDIANTAVARGKIYLAKNRGEPIPDTWALSPDGAPTTDAAEGVLGVLLANIGICAVGTLLAAMAAASRTRELILPLLFLPLAIPLVVTYLATGLVPRVPTAILVTGMIIVAVLCVFSGLILDTVTRGRREVRRLAYLALPAPGADRL